MLIISVSLLPAIKLRPQSEEDVEVKVSFAVNAKESRNRGSQGIEKTASGQGNKRLALEKIQRTVQAWEQAWGGYNKGRISRQNGQGKKQSTRAHTHPHTPQINKPTKKIKHPLPFSDYIFGVVWKVNFNN